MKPISKALLASLVIALALNAYEAMGQTDEPAATAAAKAEKARKAADFAAREKAMQDASRSSASGAVASPASEAVPYNKNKNKGKAAADEAMDILSFKGSKAVDKNAKPAAPMKSLSKMTPQERDELRREVAKEAKP